LRAGWRLALYVALAFALNISTAILLSPFLSPGRFSLRNELVQESSGFVVVLASAAFMAWIEKRPIGVYGLPPRSAFRGLFWQGCLFGLIEISGVVGVIALLGGYSFGPLAIHGGEVVYWGFSWAIVFLLVGLFEEFLFRGYTQFTLAEGIGFWPAAAVLSICFGVTHRQNPGENMVGVIGVMLVGLFWSFTLKRTGSLWFAVGMHAAFDFGESFLYSVPDSGLLLPGHLSNAALHGPRWLTGGTPGPEASIFDFLMLIIFFFVFDRMYAARRVASS